jgi:acetylornithine deacetylase/succinyl-diaminopimelate desuccinylase-like protein
MKLPYLAAFLLCLATATAAQKPPETAREYTAAHRAELVRQFSELLSIPNVAADPANLKRNADVLLEGLRKRGIDSRLLSLPGAPSVVFGKIDVPGAQHTIVFYAHYDGQPVTPSEWDGGSPFTPIVREVNGEQRIYARSAGDDKAAIFAQLTAFDALKAAGIPLRANLRFVWEGEEEAGSPHLEQIVPLENLEMSERTGLILRSIILPSDVDFSRDAPLHLAFYVSLARCPRT